MSLVRIKRGGEMGVLKRPVSCLLRVDLHRELVVVADRSNLPVSRLVEIAVENFMGEVKRAGVVQIRVEGKACDGPSGAADGVPAVSAGRKYDGLVTARELVEITGFDRKEVGVMVSEGVFDEVDLGEQLSGKRRQLMVTEDSVDAWIAAGKPWKKRRDPA